MKLFHFFIGGVIATAVITGSFAFTVKADPSPSTNIDSNYRYAWGDSAGWFDLHGAHAVKVKSLHLEGYGSSSLGEISLDCFTSPSGNICSQSNYGICNGPGPHDSSGDCINGNASGELSGFAWNDTIGWISFNCDGSSYTGNPADDKCLQSDYNVGIDSDGSFTGFAWNDAIGWISFNCNNLSACGTSDYKVNTDWRAGSLIGSLESSTIDGGESAAVPQSIVWQGSQPAGTSVDFQMAVSNCPNGETDPPVCGTGTWNFVGPSGNAGDYFGIRCPAVGVSSPAAGPDNPICLDKNLFFGYRYFRYKVRLISNIAQTVSPQVDDVIINWAR